MRSLMPFIVLIAACQPKVVAEPVAVDAQPTLSDVVHSAMDEAADPCVDFERYACGEWIDANKDLPADKSSKTRSFTSIQEKNEDLVKRIMNSASEDASNDVDNGNPEWRKLGDFYGACMATDAIDAVGISAIQDKLDLVDGLTRENMATVLGALHQGPLNPLFATGVGADLKDPSGPQFVEFSQAGLGLPQKSYYLDEDEKSVGIRASYIDHVSKMFVLAGADEESATADAQAILAFETKLAEISRSPVEMRNPQAQYNPMTMGELAVHAPMDWAAYMTAFGFDMLVVDGAINADAPTNLAVPEFAKGTLEIAAAADLATLKAYMRWHTISGYAGIIGSDFKAESFAFYSTKLRGTPEQSERWKQCVRTTTSSLRDIVGKAYVNEAFAGESKTVALGMIDYIEGAFDSNLPSLAWMDEETRAGAVDKLSKFTKKIGYPDVWMDYSSVDITTGYAANAFAIQDYQLRRMIDKVGEPMDDNEWHMPPSIVNAYYNPVQNEMVFPAGILQAPFFDVDFPMAMNLGGIGMVIGHELTHGFDDSGSQFNGDGEMIAWWNESAVEAFKKETQCVEDEYSSYEVMDGVMVNGSLTLGENIADLGGLKQALIAYRAWVVDNGEEEIAVEGLTNEQLLFVNFAQGWCNVSTPEYAEMLTKVDSHSPPRFRINGAAAHTAAFAEVFECAAETPMNPTDKCEVW
jgi:predicted metalloendopeptidase